MTMGTSDKKFSFALAGKKKSNKKKKSSSSSKKESSPTTSSLKNDFGASELGRVDDSQINTDLPAAPLVIPLQKDTRKSLQEASTVRVKVENGANANGATNAADVDAEARPEPALSGNGLGSSNDNGDENQTGATGQIKEEDLAAIKALKKEAADGSRVKSLSGDDQQNKDLIIAAGKNKFQREKQNESDKQQLDNELNKLSAELDVESDAYRSVPIRDFGAALLRGMGWSGDGSKSNADEPMNMPRPSRLGLGAIPKMLEKDAPQTHSRRPQTQNQAEKDRRMREQQKEFEQKQKQQILMDKQKTLQIGSIVWVSPSGSDEKSSSKGKRHRRAVIRKLQGVPGLNMILVQFEDEKHPEKIKKGSIELLDRQDLHKKPFQHAAPEPEKTERKRQTSNNDDRPSKVESTSRDGSSSRRDKNEKEVGDDDRRRDRKRDRDQADRDRSSSKSSRRTRDESPSNQDRDRDRNRSERKRDRKSASSPSANERKRRRGDDADADNGIDDDDRNGDARSSNGKTWLITNIRVRVITKKFGSANYKQKGVVLDVTYNGKATLRMASGEVIHAAERHLETALPKAGGNAVILMGRNKFNKGKLLERDSKRCKGAIQLFDDMSIVNLSLDDIAEWCGPLDDDLME